ncbi:MAG: septum formation initiator family protein [Eubacteriales bacterium]
MRRIKFKKRVNIFVKAVVFTFIIFCSVTIISQQLEFSELSETRTGLQRQISDTRQQIEELKENLAQSFDDEYIKKIARAKLKYHLPEEIIFYNDLIK